MKKIVIPGLLLLFIAACNNSKTDKEVKTDTTNQVNNYKVVNSPTAATFLSNVANAGMAEVEVTALAQQKAQNQEVKDLAAMLNHDHTALNGTVKSLASQENVALPDSMSADKRQMISDLNKKTGKDFDRAFIDAMISAHEASIASFEKTASEETDADVKNFASQTLPKLREHRDKAVALQKKLFP